MATLPVDKKQYVCLSANVLSFRWCIDEFWCWFSILFVSVYVKMVYFCCVNGCKTEWYPGCGLSFHRMPKDESVVKKWKQIIPGKITKTSVVCNLHFKDQDFVNEFKKRLKGDAVPSIFPKVFAAEKKIYVLSNIQLNEPSTSEPPEKKQKIQEKLDKSLQTENLTTPRKKIFKGKIKILSQRRIVFDIVKFAEKLFVTLSHQCEQKFTKNYMMNVIIHQFYPRLNDIHHPVHSLTTESRHELELIRCIANRYLSLRMKTYAKEETLKIMGNRISMRQRLHKTILFSNV